jgi:hypothetical protein
MTDDVLILIDQYKAVDHLREGRFEFPDGSDRLAPSWRTGHGAFALSGRTLTALSQ